MVEDFIKLTEVLHGFLMPVKQRGGQKTATPLFNWSDATNQSIDASALLLMHRPSPSRQQMGYPMDRQGGRTFPSITDR